MDNEEERPNEQQTAIAPMLSVRRGAQAIEFYKAAFGATERFAKTYPAERMEAAAQRCLRTRAYTCQSMDSILKNQLDRLPMPGDPPIQPTVNHENIRGADYFDSPPEAEPPVMQ